MHSSPRPLLGHPRPASFTGMTVKVRPIRLTGRLCSHCGCCVDAASWQCLQTTSMKWRGQHIHHNLCKPSKMLEVMIIAATARPVTLSPSTRCLTDSPAVWLYEQPLALNSFVAHVLDSHSPWRSQGGCCCQPCKSKGDPSSMEPLLGLEPFSPNLLPSPLGHAARSAHP